MAIINRLFSVALKRTSFVRKLACADGLANLVRTIETARVFVRGNEDEN